MKKFILIFFISFFLNNCTIPKIINNIEKKNNLIKKVLLLNVLSQSSLKDPLTIAIGNKYQCPTTIENLSTLNFAIQLTGTTIVNQQTIALSNQIGKQIKSLTNQYRVSKGRRALIWDQRLADVGRPHTVAMARGTAPFSHAGFEQRFAKYKSLVPGTVSFAENLFYGYGFSADQIARVAVNAWKRSPGHNANLLGNYNRIGVAAFRNSQNVWYITQLFALVR